jgi:hypothetical protein
MLWLNDLIELNKSLPGSVNLKTIETNLSCEIIINKLGKVDINIHLEPKGTRDNHNINFEIDYSSVNILISQLKLVIKKYPIIGER